MRIGRYELRGVLGEGGWATVYLAWDPKLRREVALKALKPDEPVGSAAHRRFLNEADTLARLQHPHIVTVFDVETDAPQPFYTMEHVQGQSVARLDSGGRGLSLEQTDAIITAIADALDYLHALGLVHGDIKPANILLDSRDRPMLIDFGLVHSVGAGNPDGLIIGTPPYMAPELVQRETGIAASDIYALGVVAYEALTGRTPFAGEMAAVLEAHLHAPVPSLRQFRPDVSAAVERVITSALAKQPWRRPARAGLFAADFSVARTTGVWEPAQATGLEGASVSRTSGPHHPPGDGNLSPSASHPSLLARPPSGAYPPPPAPSSVGFSPPPPVGMIPAPPPTSAPPPGAMPGQTLANASVPPPPMPAAAERRPWWRRGGGHRADLPPAEVPPPSAPPAEEPSRGGPAVGGIELASTVFAPPAVDAGDTFFVQVFAHLPEQADAVKAVAHEFDAAAQRRGTTSIQSLIVHGERLMFDLAMPGLEIDEPIQYMVWHSRPESVQFGVTVPSDHTRGTVIGTVTISRERVPIGHIKFKLTVQQPEDTHLADPVPAATGAMHVYRNAFVSYASPDRGEVLKRTQMLERMQIGFFQDVLSLEPGQRWEQQLYRHIDDCDVFFLFWSTAAKASPWVMKEVQYALARKGSDDLAPPEIVPVIIEGPPLVPPPPELAHLHFNDRLLYFMR